MFRKRGDGCGYSDKVEESKPMQGWQSIICGYNIGKEQGIAEDGVPEGPR